MEKIFKIIRVSEDGTQTMMPQYFHNSYGVLENAVTFNMQLHKVSNIIGSHAQIAVQKWDCDSYQH